MHRANPVYLLQKTASSPGNGGGPPDPSLTAHPLYSITEMPPAWKDGAGLGPRHLPAPKLLWKSKERVIKVSRVSRMKRCKPRSPTREQSPILRPSEIYSGSRLPPQAMAGGGWCLNVLSMGEGAASWMPMLPVLAARVMLSAPHSVGPLWRASYGRWEKAKCRGRSQEQSEIPMDHPPRTPASWELWKRRG